METGNLLGFQTLCHMIVYLGRGSHAGSNGAPSPPSEREIQLVHVLPSPPMCLWSTHTQRLTPFIARSIAPHSVHAGEVRLPSSKRRDTEPHHLHLYLAFTARDPVLLSLRAGYSLLNLSFPICKLKGGKLLQPATWENR